MENASHIVLSRARTRGEVLRVTLLGSTLRIEEWTANPVEPHLLRAVELEAADLNVILSCLGEYLNNGEG